MPEYLTLREVRHRGKVIRAAFDDLLRRPSVVQRPRSRQWVFFRACLDTLLKGSAAVACSRQAAVQYKFEIQDRLTRFFLSEGQPIPYVFELLDRKRALALELVPESYPSTLGYVLMVGPARPEQFPRGRSHEVREHVVSVVTDAAHAEFMAYRALSLDPLERYFVIGGPAYQRIQNVVERHKKKQRTLCEPPYNPSTMRVKRVKVLEMSRASAYVRTQEYWYLRWWSLADTDYVNIYDRTNYQRYVVVRVGGEWRVQSNEYPQPLNRARMRKPKRVRVSTPGTRLGPTLR